MISPKLIALPFFQGISQSDLNDIMGKTHFHFEKYDEGKMIIRDGERCTQLLFILDGTVEVISTASNQSFSVVEQINAPLTIQLERLFGLNQHYSFSLRSHTLCHTMRISKEEVTKILDTYDIVRLNMLNILSTRLQRADERKWLSTSDDLRKRLLSFFSTHCIYPAGQKDIHIKMNTLATELNDSRLNISRQLNQLQSEGFITLSRAKIHIPALEHMFM